MARVIPTPAARGDLLEIRDYSLDQFGAEAADTYFLGFDEAFELLERYPLAGPAKAEFGKGIRCLIHRRHRIFYRVDKEIVLIIRVIHHARDPRRAFKA